MCLHSVINFPFFVDGNTAKPDKTVRVHPPSLIESWLFAHTIKHNSRGTAIVRGTLRKKSVLRMWPRSEAPWCMVTIESILTYKSILTEDVQIC